MLNTTPLSLARQLGSPRRRKARSSGCSLSIVRLQHWTDLSPATRRQRDNIFKQESSRRQDTSPTHRSRLQPSRPVKNAALNTPAQARNFLDAMRGLFRWAHKAGLIKHDPTAGVLQPEAQEYGWLRRLDRGYMSPSTRPVGLLARDNECGSTCCYTPDCGVAMRCVLVVSMCAPVLLRSKRKRAASPSRSSCQFWPYCKTTLDAGPCGDLTFIAGANDRPLTKESFGNEFKAACKEAGVPGSAHGVRKIAATTAADNGATEFQLMAIFGWTDPKMAAHYVKTANRKRLAAQAMQKLNAERTSIPAPFNPVRAVGEKSK